MIILSQRDPTWSLVKIGKTPFTIGKLGCTITCLAMLSDYFGSYVSPTDIARRATFTKDARIYWNSIPVKNMVFEKRLYVRNDREILKSLADPDRAVLLEVNHSHWVVATNRLMMFPGYRIADPWFGDKPTTARYGQQITGSAHFKRK